MCQPKRPCDEGDIDKDYGQCIEGMRWVDFHWEDADQDGEMDCDLSNPHSTVSKLPVGDNVECKQCTVGMSRDTNGNCEYCADGTFQPVDFTIHANGEGGPVSCNSCPAG